MWKGNGGHKCGAPPENMPIAFGSTKWRGLPLAEVYALILDLGKGKGEGEGEEGRARLVKMEERLGRIEEENVKLLELKGMQVGVKSVQ